MGVEERLRWLRPDAAGGTAVVDSEEVAAFALQLHLAPRPSLPGSTAQSTILTATGLVLDRAQKFAFALLNSSRISSLGHYYCVDWRLTSGPRSGVLESEKGSRSVRLVYYHYRGFLGHFFSFLCEFRLPPAADWNSSAELKSSNGSFAAHCDELSGSLVDEDFCVFLAHARGDRPASEWCEAEEAGAESPERFHAAHALALTRLPAPSVLTFFTVADSFSQILGLEKERWCFEMTRWKPAELAERMGMGWSVPISFRLPVGLSLWPSEPRFFHYNCTKLYHRVQRDSCHSLYPRHCLLSRSRANLGRPKPRSRPRVRGGGAWAHPGVVCANHADAPAALLSSGRGPNCGRPARRPLRPNIGHFQSPTDIFWEVLGTVGPMSPVLGAFVVLAAVPLAANAFCLVAFRRQAAKGNAVFTLQRAIVYSDSFQAVIGLAYLCNTIVVMSAYKGALKLILVYVTPKFASIIYFLLGTVLPGLFYGSQLGSSALICLTCVDRILSLQTRSRVWYHAHSGAHWQERKMKLAGLVVLISILLATVLCQESRVVPIPTDADSSWQYCVKGEFFVYSLPYTAVNVGLQLVQCSLVLVLIRVYLRSERETKERRKTLQKTSGSASAPITGKKLTLILLAEISLSLASQTLMEGVRYVCQFQLQNSGMGTFCQTGIGLATFGFLINLTSSFVFFTLISSQFRRHLKESLPKVIQRRIPETAAKPSSIKLSTQQ